MKKMLMLLSLGASYSLFAQPIQEPNSDLDRELHKALNDKKLSLEKVKNLIDRGASLTSQGQYSETPLEIAACLGNADLAKLLIESGAPITSKALHTAITSGDYPSFVSLLFTKNNWLLVKEERKETFDPEVQGSIKYKTALHKAADLGRIKTVRVLLSQGASTYVFDSSGSTPLHYAVYQSKAREKAIFRPKASPYQWEAKHTAIVKLLLEHEAPTWEKDSEGHSPMDLAKSFNKEHGNNEEVIALLEEKKKNKNKPTRFNPGASMLKTMFWF